jgi:hypothetical protein
MFKTCLIFVFILCQTFVFAAPSFLSNTAFETFEQKPFVVYYVGKDLAHAKEAAKILAKAYDELVFDFQFEPARRFDVYLMPTRKSFRDALGGRLPEWTGAYANPMYNRMVVKSPRWNSESSFENSLVHELVHLVVHNYLGVRDLPRWMDEGLAIFYSGEQRWKTATALSKAISTNSLIPLSDIDYVLEYHQVKADLAYQQSYSAVHYMLRTYDIEAVRQILSDIRMGAPVQKAFFDATASSLTEFEIEWQTYARKTHKWMWFYEIDEFVWVFIFVLVVLAFIARRIRNKSIERQWQEEQEIAARLRLEFDDSSDHQIDDLDVDDTERSD